MAGKGLILQDFKYFWDPWASWKSKVILMPLFLFKLVSNHTHIFVNYEIFVLQNNFPVLYFEHNKNFWNKSKSNYHIQVKYQNMYTLSCVNIKEGNIL